VYHASGLETATMQQIAAEMAVSETAFLALDEYRLRWFTPRQRSIYAVTARSPRPIFCARPGSLLWESVVFTTLSGPLKATAGPDTIELDFPLWCRICIMCRIRLCWMRWVSTPVTSLPAGIWPESDDGGGRRAGN
jgi:hypothetical protein